MPIMNMLMANIRMQAMFITITLIRIRTWPAATATIIRFDRSRWSSVENNSYVDPQRLVNASSNHRE